MKRLVRSTLVLTALAVLVLAVAALVPRPSVQAADSSQTAVAAANSPEAVLPGDLGLPEPVELAGCSASTTCSDGSMLSCTGGFGDLCQESSESCTVLDCNGSRNFVQCGSTKKVCPCNTGSCVPCSNPNNCNPGLKCKTQDQCGPCGACVRGSCVCIAPA